MARRLPLRREREIAPRFGIGEWYGIPITQLTPAERRALAAELLKQKKDRAAPPACRFRAANPPCSKDGGVCSLRLYEYREHPGTGRAMGVPAEGAQGAYRITCPYRFHENYEVFRWVGSEILGDDNPKLMGEVGFLESTRTTDTDGGDDVGKIDMIMVSSKTHPEAPMDWCAVEIQAVYFSGDAMRGEFAAAADPSLEWLHFPSGNRHPDYRSSGPKRLMPQLQIKVPTLRRWGKKMAVIVDQAFFDSMGEMDHVEEISNADIAWFIVEVEEVANEKRTKLVPKQVRYTTLERSVEGLTGGKPVAKGTFEDRIRAKAKLIQGEPELAIDLNDPLTRDA